jgi:Uma2 family endonuclease
MEALTLKIPNEYPMTDDELFAFCVANKELRIERDSKGQLILMSPTGSLSGNINFKILSMFGNWADAHEDMGYGFDSSSGFRLPDGSMRSPDVAWVRKEKWEKLSEADQKKFAPVCPDFLIEIKSDTDSIKSLQQKMLEWIKNGCQLAWLIDPAAKRAYVYNQNGLVREYDDFDQKLDGGDLLPGFQLDLSRLK